MLVEDGPKCARSVFDGGGGRCGYGIVAPRGTGQSGGESTWGGQHVRGGRTLGAETAATGGV